MAINKETKTVLGSGADKIGKYAEAAGGGDPLEKGESFRVADTPEEAEQMREANPGTKVRVNQPRNPDGTFGYNSQNARKLKYGPSRGETVPDFLRGVDLLFLKKGGSLVMQGENSVEYYLSTIDMTKEQLIENCKHYLKSTEGFAGLHEGMMIKKKGRHSDIEKARAEELTKPTTQGKKVSGAVPINNRPKLSANTLRKMDDAKLEYDKIEKALKGIDAGSLLALGNTWGEKDFNRRAATEKDVSDREEWRKEVNRPRFNANKIRSAMESVPQRKEEKEEKEEKVNTGVGDKVDIDSVRALLTENGVEGFEDLSDNEIKELFNEGILTLEMFGIEDTEEEEKAMELLKV